MKKGHNRRKRKKPDIVIRVGRAVTDAAEKGLSKTVNLGLDVVAGVLKAISPFSR